MWRFRLEQFHPKRPLMTHNDINDIPTYRTRGAGELESFGWGLYLLSDLPPFGNPDLVMAFVHRQV
jgi:hypothetical protein